MTASANTRVYAQRWCLSPRDGLFFSRGGKHQLDCGVSEWHTELECWRPHTFADIDLAKRSQQDASVNHLGKLCDKADIERLVAASTKAATSAAANARLMNYTIPLSAQIGQQLRVLGPDGNPIHFVVPVGESFMRVHWVAVPKAMGARRVNRSFA
eukprot:SAG25_NODE_1534_length_2831_cov_3.062592_1_plen_155_part_10